MAAMLPASSKNAKRHCKPSAPHSECSNLTNNFHAWIKSAQNPGVLTIRVRNPIRGIPATTVLGALQGYIRTQAAYRPQRISDCIDDIPCRRGDTIEIEKSEESRVKLPALGFCGIVDNVFDASRRLSPRTWKTAANTASIVKTEERILPDMEGEAHWDRAGAHGKDTQEFIKKHITELQQGINILQEQLTSPAEAKIWLKSTRTQNIGQDMKNMVTDVRHFTPDTVAQLPGRGDNIKSLLPTYFKICFWLTVALVEVKIVLWGSCSAREGTSDHSELQHHGHHRLTLPYGMRHSVGLRNSLKMAVRGDLRGKEYGVLELTEAIAREYSAVAHKLEDVPGLVLPSSRVRLEFKIDSRIEFDSSWIEFTSQNGQTRSPAFSCGPIGRRSSRLRDRVNIE
ncbi:hypothetical protein B0H14DRAFT_2574971 [Mycena olivaceomarginata]|nr:hypothetical protein B0H14DRAFT_2574971 [Mycena olivaceomarginata]